VLGGDAIAFEQLVGLTAAWNLEPSNARWSPDSRFIYFTAETGGEIHLFRVAAVAGAKVEQVTKGPRRLNNLTIDKAFTTIAYVVGAHDAPGDLYAANIDGSNERRTGFWERSRPRTEVAAADRGAGRTQ